MNTKEAIIAVVGAPGTGKSTLVGHISEKFGTYPRYETSEGNPYIYDASTSQTHVLENQVWYLEQSILRFSTAIHVRQNEGIGSALDTIPQTNILFSRLLLDTRDYGQFKLVADQSLSTIPLPNITVYLHDDPEYLASRMKKRKRPLDDPENISFIADLQHLHDAWIETIPEAFRLILRSRDLENALQERAIIQKIQGILENNTSL